jgi:phosphatidylglycerophosphatase B
MIVTLSEKGEDMLSIARRTAAGAAILLIMPLAVWISGWMWQPGQNATWLKSVLGNGNGHATVGDYHPCAALRLVSVVPAFSSAPALMLLHSRRLSWSAGREILGERSRSGAASFCCLAGKTHHVPVDEFYNLKRKDRGALVKEQLAEQQDIPKFLRKHWQKETGFAFPSGHTMFAASWALLGVGLLAASSDGHHRRVTGLGDGSDGKPLLLGMHWPRDLVVATLISWVLVTFATWLAERLCGPLTPPEEKKEIAEREQTGSEG